MTIDERSAPPASPASASEPVLPPGFLPRDCSFRPEDWAILSAQWFPVARIADVGERPLAVTLLDLPLVIYRAGDAIRVARDLCPHRGSPLSMGWVEGQEIVCAYHGLRYGPDGRCRRIPAHPDVEPSPKLKLAMFPVVERYGLVWTRLDPANEGVELPAFPLWDAPGFQAILPPFVDIAGSAGRQVEGFVDVAHFAWIHHRAFADRDNPLVPVYDTRFTAFGLRTDYWSDVGNYPKGLGLEAPPGFRWLRRFEIYPPFAASLTIFFPGEDRLGILNVASPVSARKTRMFAPMARNFDVTGSLDAVYAFNAQIFAEDQAIIERQYPEELPLDPKEEAHFPADRTSIGYRRLLRQMGLTFKPIA